MPATVKKSPAMEPAHRACAGSSPGRHPVIFPPQLCGSTILAGAKEVSDHFMPAGPIRAR
jgi:hypothetical protein